VAGNDDFLSLRQTKIVRQVILHLGECHPLCPGSPEPRATRQPALWRRWRGPGRCLPRRHRTPLPRRRAGGTEVGPARVAA
jgi:hypothetical protein